MTPSQQFIWVDQKDDNTDGEEEHDDGIDDPDQSMQA